MVEVLTARLTVEVSQRQEYSQNLEAKVARWRDEARKL